MSRSDRRKRARPQFTFRRRRARVVLLGKNRHEIDPGATDFWVYQVDSPNGGYWVEVGPNPTIPVGNWTTRGLSVVTNASLPLPPGGCQVLPLPLQQVVAFPSQRSAKTAHWVFPAREGYATLGQPLSYWIQYWPSAVWWRIVVSGSVTGFMAFVAGEPSKLHFFSVVPGATSLNHSAQGPLPMDFTPVPLAAENRTVYAQE